MINHTQIAHVCVVNTHAGTRFNPGLDDFAQLVHNVTRPVENITARVIRVILTNNERFGGLVIGSRAVLNRRWDDRSRYGYCFCSGLLPFEPGCANASSAISVQAIVTIVVFIITPPVFNRHKLQNFVQ